MARTRVTGSLGLVVHPPTDVRHERDWACQDLVDVIARRLKTAACREKAWRRENWAVVPDGHAQLVLAAELGVPAAVVHSLGWPDWLPTGERIATDTPWTLDGGICLLRGAAGAAVLDHRGFLILARAPRRGWPGLGWRTGRLFHRREPLDR